MRESCLVLASMAHALGKSLSKASWAINLHVMAPLKNTGVGLSKTVRCVLVSEQELIQVKTKFGPIAASSETFVVLLKEALEKHSVNIIADDLKVSCGTVRLWLEGRNIPHELLREDVIRYLTSKV